MMNTFKRLLIGLLCVGVLLCFVACTSGDDTADTPDTKPVETQEKESNEPETEEVEEPASAGFKVTVVDDSGATVPGVILQVCLDTCIPAVTDADGVANFNIEVTSEHKLSVLTCPEGYEYNLGDIYLENGMTESTVIITKVA